MGHTSIFLSQGLPHALHPIHSGMLKDSGLMAHTPPNPENNHASRRITIMPATDTRLLDNESGFVLVLSLLILLILVVIGVALTRDAQLDLLISRNDKASKQNFYKAEGVVTEYVQTLENAPATALKDKTVPGLTDGDALGMTATTSEEQVAAIVTSTFRTAGGIPSTSALAGGNTTARFMAIDRGGAPGSSLSVTQSQVHVYNVYGYATENGSQAIISLGYKKRW